MVQVRFKESIENILSTARTFFLNEFSEILFDAEDPRLIEQKLAQVPGLLISLFTEMAEQRKRKRTSVKNRVTFSTVEDVVLHYSDSNRMGVATSGRSNDSLAFDFNSAISEADNISIQNSD